MSVAAFLYRQLVDLLEDHRVVVWYDAEGAFREWATQSRHPNASPSTRRLRSSSRVVGRTGFAWD